MTAARSETKRIFAQINRATFSAEIHSLAAFYGGRIPLAWEDKLEELLDTVKEQEENDATD